MIAVFVVLEFYNDVAFENFQNIFSSNQFNSTQIKKNTKTSMKKKDYLYEVCFSKLLQNSIEFVQSLRFTAKIVIIHTQTNKIATFTRK